MAEATRVLLASNHLDRLGGSESYTYALCMELCRRGIEVDLFAFRHGLVSERASALARITTAENLNSRYEFGIVSHRTCVEFVRSRVDFLVQICHGTFPELEQPNPSADVYVAVSDEVKEHLRKLGHVAVVIPQAIDCARFRPKSPASARLTAVLSLCQGDAAHAIVESACARLGLRLSRLHKDRNGIWEIEQAINEADLVVGIGRSAAEAAACGRAVLVFDSRDYACAAGDGLLMESTRAESLKHNFSGRRYGKVYDAEMLARALEGYSSRDAAANREFAIHTLNVENAVTAYQALRS